jgi:hypothetical protein
MEALKPCPFCGYDLQESDFAECIAEGIEPVTRNLGYKVRCPFCDCCSSKNWSVDQSVEVWNRRVLKCGTETAATIRGGGND